MTAPLACSLVLLLLGFHVEHVKRVALRRLETIAADADRAIAERITQLGGTPMKRR